MNYSNTDVQRMSKTILILTTLFIMTNSNQAIAQTKGLVTDLSIDHLVGYPSSFQADNKEKRYPLILAFHGHGSNEQDLIGLSAHLPKNLFWISGRGPHTLSKGSYDWYELPPSPEKIAAILKTINTFVEEVVRTYPIDPDQIYLLGFSQGSMISLSYVLAYPERIAGVIAQSGAIPSDIGLEINKEGLKGKPIVITHGTEDRAMPIVYGRKTRDTLIELGADVNFNEFPMGHSISNESLSVVRKWLEAKL